MASQREIAEQLFEAALTLDPAERNAFLSSKCGTASELRRMVDDLLAEDARAGSFLQHPPLDFLNNAMGQALVDQTAFDTNGTSSRPMLAARLKSGYILMTRFEILRYLNRGGMGEVYAAWDSELHEFVALKTIRPEIMSDPSVIRYFKDEVKQA